MANPPNNSTFELVRNQTRVAVYVSDDADTDPTEADEQPAWSPVSIRYGAGMQLAEARIAVDLRKVGRRIKDVKLTKDINRRLEIWTLKEEIEGDTPSESLRDKPLFKGELLGVGLQVSPDDSELKELIAQVVPYHFGDILLGQEQWNESLGETENVPIELEFNPLVDAQIVQNMVGETDDRNPNDYPIWVDVEATRSQTAEDEYHGTAEDWSLRKAIKTICKIGNAGETFLKNPESDHLEEILGNAPNLKNVVVPFGHRACNYLQTILQRYGFNFKLSLEEGDGGLEQRIALYEIGKGTVKRLRLQAFGSTPKVRGNNTNQLSLSFEIGSLANKLYLYGARRERELTIPLVRAWPSDEDNDISSSAIDARAGRLWCANEGGDYKDLRSEIGDPPDLFGHNTIPRKRVLENCLTYLPNTTTRQPTVLEYSTDGGDTWTRVEGSGGEGNGLQAAWTPLPNEIGVFFTDETLPSELHSTSNENLKLRITGTVRDDLRIEHDTDYADDSPNSNSVQRLLDVSDQFFDRKREDSGSFASELTGPADERDDQDAIEAYGDDLLKIDSAAQIQTSIVIPGLSTEYEIGDILRKVDGREISFNRHSDQAGEEKFIQIVGLEYQFSESEIFTILLTEAYDV